MFHKYVMLTYKNIDFKKEIPLVENKLNIIVPVKRNRCLFGNSHRINKTVLLVCYLSQILLRVDPTRLVYIFVIRNSHS